MKLNPYLTFNGNCKEALNFYREVLDGEITYMKTFAESEGQMPYKKEYSEKIMHANLTVGDFQIMGSDNMGDDFPFEKGNNFSLSLEFKNEDESAARIFSGLSENGHVIMPFKEVFWGGKFGMLTDQFGVQWMVSNEG